MHSKTIAVIAFALALAFCACGQTTGSTFTLPTAVSAVAEFNQLGSPRWSLGISAIYAPSAQSSIGMYDSTTADVVPVKAKDPASGKSFYALNASIRQGVHERIFCAGTFTDPITKATGPRGCFLLGGDLGPGFQNSPSGVSVSATASFVATTWIRVNRWLGVVVPIRMLYIPAVGFNPVVQAGLSFNPGAIASK